MPLAIVPEDEARIGRAEHALAVEDDDRSGVEVQRRVHDLSASSIPAPGRAEAGRKGMAAHEAWLVGP